jgi:hypothetical protein
VKRVVYFKAGVVADFEIDDEDYDSFTEQLKEAPSPDDAGLLEHSRQVLDSCIREAEEGVMGDEERAAACYLWHYFNDNTDPAASIDGDVIVIDEKGDGSDVRYAPLAAVKLSQVN